MRFLLIIILFFLSFILYNIPEFIDELIITYKNGGAFYLIISSALHLFFLFMPFFVTFILLFSIILILFEKIVSMFNLKNESHITKKLDENEEKITRFKNQTIALPIILFILNICLFISNGETLLSLIYPLNVNDIIDDILGTPCLFCPINEGF